MDLVNNPTKIFGNKTTPYALLVQDDANSTIFGGGISFIIGYTYVDDKYGAQLVLKYGDDVLRFRNKYSGNWSDLTSIIK